MFPILLTVGPFTLHTYGLLVALGFLAAYQVARRNFEKANLPASLNERLFMGMMISAIVGARLLYVLLEDHDNFFADPLSFFRIWEGGLVFFGGFIAGFFFLVFTLKRESLDFLFVVDQYVAPVLLAQSIGRLGCLAAGCCYGKPTASWVGLVFRHPETLAPRFVPLLPTQLYSSFGDLLLFWGALTLQRKHPRPGTLWAYYLVSYGLFRFIIEFLRGDFRGAIVGGLQPSQWISLVLIGCGLFLFRHVRKKI